MLFFGVFLRESSRTAAKSRTNLSTNSGKANKWLDRLAPNLAHMCKFIWEWIYAKQIAPQDTRGHLGYFRGSTRLNTRIQVAPQYSRGHFGGGGVRVSQIQKSGEDVKRLDRLPPNLAHICRSIWKWIYAKQIAPQDTRGTRGGCGGQTFKSLGKLSNGWTDWHQLWFTSAD